MANIGQLSERLTYTGVTTYTDSGWGEMIPTQGAPVDCWCSAIQISGKENLSYGLNLTEASYRFIVRYEHGQAINTTTLLTYKGREFNVLAPPLNSAEDDRFIIILASERRL